MEWISFAQLENLRETAQGGYGDFYRATFSDRGEVAVKSFYNQQDFERYFLNEVIIFTPLRLLSFNGC